MTYITPIIDAIRASGRSAREVSLASVGHDAAIKNIKRGVDPRGSTLLALCRELGLEFYIGPPRGEPLAAASTGTVAPEIADALGLDAGIGVEDAVRAIESMTSGLEAKALRTEMSAIVSETLRAEVKKMTEEIIKSQSEAVEMLAPQPQFRNGALFIGVDDTKKEGIGPDQTDG